MIMNKIVGMAALLLCLTGCVRDNDAIYYPVGDVDIERGGPALEVGEVFIKFVIIDFKNPVSFGSYPESTVIIKIQGTYGTFNFLGIVAKHH